MEILSMVPGYVYMLLAVLVLSIINLKLIGIRIIPSDCVGIQSSD